ncbi:glycoside hydrolase family 65 protein [Suhomyces tanzawaensis NRRL Y-17324]|uniref:alpha,alpha-trehalase n=1 Tax=Suhomyces tanzawaensis NRRL Y-17324 TaxID=984487 RepID=A0A1E4SE08_9ASCO|nr:glycoside hydrolase family 65 protein [Suhomyces tanzawaensis NRRL Y-17324]ODV77632.1 glycoside hydrolase family 65 protein [Suhomyces tanzawaensis NRRL Y-17324]
MMIVANLAFLLVLQLTWDVLWAHPLTVPKLFAASNLSADTVHTDRDALFALINSTANKQVFSQLKYSSSAYYDLDANIVGSAEFAPNNQYQRQPYVANGYIGARIPNLGQGFTYDQLSTDADATDADLLNGWPLYNKRYAGAFIAGFYDIQANTTETNFPELEKNGYESIIAAVPQWTALELSTTVDGVNYTLNPALESHLQGSISNYAQNLSLSDGIVSTEFTWLDSVQVKIEILAHRHHVNLGVVHLELANIGSSALDIKVRDVLDFATAQRSQLASVDHDQDGIYITFQPNEIDYVNGAIYSTLLSDHPPNFEQATNGTVAQSLDIQLQPGSTFKVTKYAGIVSSDLDPANLKSEKDVLSLARRVSQSFTDIKEVFETHKTAWAQTLESTPAVTFPNDLLLTIAARASIYHLAANTRTDAEGVTAALPVVGLSSDSYGGMVFWDTDLWMFNGLLPFLPSHAKSLINYRIHTHEQAKKNVPAGYEGAAYPWTSGRFGNCTSTGPCVDYEYHINMAVASSAWNLYLSGEVGEDFLESVAYPLIKDAATFFSEYVVKLDESTGKYVTHNLTDPDEYANHVDNGAYTNAGISLVMKWAIDVSNHLGKEVPSQFMDISDNVLMPTSNNSDQITLEYSGMNATVGIKQADVIMVNYPLENELITPEQALKNMEFYSKKQVSYGPAMTFPIFSIVASNVSPSGCASQSYLRKAVQPFLRGPFAQFSEQNNDDFLTNGGTHPAFPFMTAHGGFLQAIMQGLTGLRYDFAVKHNKIQRVLKLDPIAIPCLGGGVFYDGIHFDNHTLTMSINETYFTVKNNGPANEFASESIEIRVGERNKEAGQHTLKNGETLTIPIFTPGESYKASITECALSDFVNITAGAYGDATVLMNDGDNTTNWQVASNTSVGKVLIDLKEYKNVTKGFFNWGDKPPKQVKLSAYNSLHDLQNTTAFLSKIDFGNEVYTNYAYANPSGELIKQEEVFESFLEESVDVTVPFTMDDFLSLTVPVVFNTTTFELPNPVFTRFVLLELQGIHDTEPIDLDTSGAKVYEAVLY